MPSAIYDAIVIRAVLRGWRVAAVGLGRNENVARKTHSPRSSLSRRLSKCFSASAVKENAHPRLHYSLFIFAGLNSLKLMLLLVVERKSRRPNKKYTGLG